jgi:hypothetical protein
MSSTTFDTCNECGDKFDAQDPSLPITLDGSTRCNRCDLDFILCDHCGDEHHIDEITGWDGAAICQRCDELYGATCDTCGQRMHADSVEYCCNPSKPSKP